MLSAAFEAPVLAGLLWRRRAWMLSVGLISWAGFLCETTALAPANQDQQESGLHNQVKIGVSWCGSHLALSAADETRAYRPRRRRSLGNQSLSRARIAKPPFEMSG